MDSKIKMFLASFSKALKNKNAAVFAGAGLSVNSGFVNWKDLLRTVAEELGLDVDTETDLIAIAQYHSNDRMGRGALNQLIIEELTKQSQLTENHRILAKLPIETYWTTNYDQLIEQALIGEGKQPDVKIVQENLAINKPKRNAIVYKMHGDVQLPDKAILTKEDYETYEINRQLYSVMLQGDLLSKTFLFIGFSFEDPNLIYILSRVKNLIGPNNTKQHYCFFKREIDTTLFKRQELKIRDLNRYGINGLLIDEYEEITTMLKKVQDLYKTSNVFISGSIEDYSLSTKGEVASFTDLLSKELLKRDLKIISGFGLGIGSNIVNGALNHIFTTNYRNLDEYLILRPFPKGETDSQLKKEINSRYRKSMISEAGFAIFIYGNKKDNKGDVINSSGVLEEFEIAKKLGVNLLPIGATGFRAKELWLLMMDNFHEYFPNHDELKPKFAELGDVNISTKDIIKNIIFLIDSLTKIKYS